VRRNQSPALIRAARQDMSMTQVELASAAGVPRSTLAAYESGRRRPHEETLTRILDAARTRPSVPLAILADDIRAAAAICRIDAVRVFGSVLTGQDTDRSDIDLLVRTRPETSLFDVSEFALAVEKLTGFRVDVVTEAQVRNSQLAHLLDTAEQL
jgi:predicted nucleotidyltransferase/DNA-binding XRE family transcriptional regulator